MTQTIRRKREKTTAILRKARWSSTWTPKTTTRKSHKEGKNCTVGRKAQADLIITGWGWPRPQPASTAARTTDRSRTMSRSSRWNPMSPKLTRNRISSVRRAMGTGGWRRRTPRTRRGREGTSRSGRSWTWRTTTIYPGSLRRRRQGGSRGSIKTGTQVEGCGRTVKKMTDD